jgi:hypothetical protein
VFVSIGAPFWGTGTLLSYGLREEGEIFFSGELLLRNSRDMKKRLWKRANISISVPVGEHGGGSFTEAVLRQMKEGSGNEASLTKLVWAPFIWVQIMLGACVCGQSELL